ncbi:MAG: ABC transporter substrate-binding protein [Candidatus Dormibacteraeota bacterium]|nr:ABC transporter substrate-binding protein [Candidatus Dormibacteraeota bacterium]
MRARFLSTGVALLLALAACSGGAIAGGLPAGPVKIGLVTSLSGIDLPLGADLRTGAQQAVDEANTGGGIGGHEVKLVVADDQSAAGQAGPAFSGLVAGGAAGVVGPLTAAGELAVAHLAASKRIPILSTSGADSVVGTGGRVSGNVFLAAPAASRAAERMLTYVRKASITQLAVAHEAGEAFADIGVATLHADAAKYGAKVVADQPIDPATADFKPIFAAVRASGAKLLLVWGSGTAEPLLERAWKDSGLGIPILLSVASCTTAFLRAVSDSGEGALVECSASVLTAALPAGSAIRRQVDPMATAFQQRNGYFPTQAAFDGYAGARLLLRAVQEAGSSDPAKVNAALARLELATASGTFKFTDRDHRGLPSSWLAIAVVKDGKLTPAA